MVGNAYYSENEPFAAQWLRNLIGAGLIAPGEVDERSIRDVQAADLRGFRQCHFFAGIGVWSHALRGAGWSDARPVWTGSCPCQPFSAAGKREGFADDRHLWPEFFRLIRECHPDTVFGEQVSSPAGLTWLDAVFADLEGADYACGALDTCAASVGAPHIRQRLYWVANALPAGRAEGRPRAGSGQVTCGGSSGWLEHAEGRGAATAQQQRCIPGAIEASATRGLADADGGQHGDGDVQRSGRLVQQPEDSLAGFWADADWLPCRDGKWRPVEPGTFPLASGVAGRVGRLRAYGNALCAPQAEAFVRAAMEVADGG